MKKQKNIGIEAKVPKKECTDKNCPYHGIIKLRGRAFTGTLVSKDTHNSAVVGWDRIVKIPKYERTENRKSKVSVHNPSCIDAQKGDVVKIVETKPISKTKKFVIIEKIE
jgi:small subunit ribosomal protein S17